MKVAGRWRYGYRAVDQFGQVIDVFVSPRRDTAAARRFFEGAIGATRVMPIEVTTDRPAANPAVLDDLQPATWHRTEQAHRMRPRPAEGAATTDARAQPGPQRHGRAGRACLGAEPSARLRRARGRGASKPSSCRRVRRAGLGDLIPRLATASACHPSTRCNRAVQGRDLLGGLLRTDGCMHAFRDPHVFTTSSAGAH
jgi:DDE domain